MSKKDSVKRLTKVLTGKEDDSNTLAESLNNLAENYEVGHTHIFQHIVDTESGGTRNLCAKEYDICTASNCTEEKDHKFNEVTNTEHTYGRLQFRLDVADDDEYYVICTKCNYKNIIPTRRVSSLYTAEEIQAARDEYESSQG